VDVVAGLLQTDGYARHIIGSYSRVEPVAPGMIGRLVKVRMQRQQVLNREDLQLRILPLSAQHTVFGESFVIFGFGEDSDAMLQDVVSTEQLRSGFTLEGERETYLHRLAFQMLAEASLDPEASKALILQTAQSHWSGARRHATA
jgi:hypothetical protein